MRSQQEKLPLHFVLEADRRTLARKFFSSDEEQEN